MSGTIDERKCRSDGGVSRGRARLARSAADEAAGAADDADDPDGSGMGGGRGESRSASVVDEYAARASELRFLSFLKPGSAASGECSSVCSDDDAAGVASSACIEVGERSE